VQSEHVSQKAYEQIAYEQIKLIGSGWQTLVALVYMRMKDHVI